MLLHLPSQLADVAAARMPAPAPTNASSTLNHLTSHISYISQALSHRCTHHDFPSLDRLWQTLQQAQEIEIWTGKEPPRLRAVEAVIKQCQQLLQDQHISDPRRDSAKESLLDKTPAQDAESALLESHAFQCTILLQKLNFATVFVTSCTDPEGLCSSIVRHTDGDNELVSIIEHLVKLRYSALRVESRGLQRHPNGTTAAVTASDIGARAWLESLARWAGLQLRSPSDLTTHSLAGLASMEYRKAVLSVETNAVREDMALGPYTSASPSIRTAIEDCFVTIKLSGHQDIHAARFKMSEEQCAWYDDEDSIVLEHNFPLLSGTDLHPWRHPVQHSSLTVAFTEQAVRGCTVRCSDGNHGEHKAESPDYVFEDAKGYATFQSCLRARTFVTEYEVTSIKKQNLEKSPAQLIKIWRHSLTRLASVTLPLTVRTRNGFDIKHEELEMSKCDCEKVGSRIAKLVVKQDRQQAASSSSACEKVVLRKLWASY